MAGWFWWRKQQPIWVQWISRYMCGMVSVICVTGLAWGQSMDLGDVSTIHAQEDRALVLTNTFFNELPQFVTKIKVVSLPDRGVLTNGTTVIEKNSIFYISNVGSIRYTSARNHYGTTTMVWQAYSNSEFLGEYVTSIHIEPVVDPILFYDVYITDAYEDSLFTYTPYIIDVDNPEYRVIVDASVSPVQVTITDPDGHIQVPAFDPATTPIPLQTNKRYLWQYVGANWIRVHTADGEVHELTPFEPTHAMTLSNNAVADTIRVTTINDITYTVAITNDPIYRFEVSNVPIWATVDSATGVLSGTPNQEHVRTYEGIQYTVIKGDQWVQSKMVTITVFNTNDLPVISPIPLPNEAALTVMEGGTVTLALTGTDADGDRIYYGVDPLPQNGQATIDGDQLIYTHNGTQTQTDSFGYYAYDMHGRSESQSITLGIIPVNDPPVVPAQQTLVLPGECVTVTVVAFDEERTVLTYDLVSAPELGSMIPNSSNPYQFEYCAPGDIPDERVTVSAMIAVTDSDSSDPQTTTQPIDITFFKKNTHPQYPDLAMADKSVVVLDNAPMGTRVTTMGGNFGTYLMDNSSYFFIHPKTGELRSLGTLASMGGTDIPLTIRASAIRNGVKMGVYATVTVTVITATDMDKDLNWDGVPDELMALGDNEACVLSKDTTIRPGWNVSKLHMTVANGMRMAVHNTTVRLASMTIMGLLPARIEMHDPGTLQIEGTMTLASEPDSIAIVDMDHPDALLNVGETVSVGAYGVGEFRINQGRAVINGAIDLGKAGSQSDIYVGEGGQLHVGGDIIIQEAGKATVAFDGGEVHIQGALDMGESADANVIISGGDVDISRVNVPNAAAFRVQGGVFQTPSFKGTLTHSGGTVTIGSRVSGVGVLSATPDTNSMMIDGSYIQYAQEGTVPVLEVVISDNDQAPLVVTEGVELTGQLHVIAPLGTVLERHKTVSIIDSPSIRGAFTSIVLPELNADLRWDTAALYTTGAIEIVSADRISPTAVTILPYPNPVHAGYQSLQLTYTLVQSTPITMDIYTLFGRKVYTNTHSSGQMGGQLGSNTVTIPSAWLKKISKGVYFVLIHDNRDVYGRGKFVVL
jgi:hypothetical protein